MRKSLLILPLLVACDSPSSDSPKTIAPSQIHEAMADFYCQVSDRCELPGDTSIFATLVRASDKAACRAFFVRMLDRFEPNLETAVQNGKVAYDGAFLTQCITRVKNSCDLDGIGDCYRAFEGKTPAGGVCETNLDCQGDAFCVLSSGSDECVSGECVLRVARGEPCDWGSQCSQAQGPSQCINDVCAAVTVETGAGEGQPCGEREEDDTAFQRTCAANLVCVYESGGGFCRAPLAAGTDCSEINIPCAAGTFCLPSGDTEICQSVTIARQVGATCNHDPEAAPLVLCSVIDQLGCDQGKCRKWGDGSVGQYCSMDFETDFACKSGFFCDGNACAALRADGAACTSDDQCRSGWCESGGTCWVDSCRP